MNKPENTLPWETKPCDFNAGWTSVGYILRGPQSGTWVPCHHWGDRRDAEAHVMFLNRGLPRDEAKERTLALVHQEVTP